ncbi:hypothetical protein SAMN05444920_14528 [Nonomuraea solani]|uniref:Uncharacterized protein n=1 Tax=Nonomuraea solani TaxID=1144553 RepID=A0A1H6F120_9ACTN|nr:hypothetical protein SAMN05444920_14528 [Nonomuraea solani]
MVRVWVVRVWVVRGCVLRWRSTCMLSVPV